MCGISGFIRTNHQFVSYATDILKDLVYYQRLRGIDAFGVFKVNAATLAHDTIKDIGEPIRILGEKKFSDFIANAGNNRFMVAHNRHATKGEKKDQGCAQPFLVKKTSGDGVIIMVHNGTLHSIRNEKEFPGKTDSHSLAKMLAAGVSLSEIEHNVFGSFALVWYDSDDHTLHFVRNKERTFGFVEAVDNSFFFASECYLAAAAMERRGQGVKDITKLPVMEEWIWHSGENEWEKKKVPLKPQSASGNGGNYHYPANPWNSEEEQFALEMEYLQRHDPKSADLAGNDARRRTVVEVPRFDQPFATLVAPVQSSGLPLFKHDPRGPRIYPRNPRASNTRPKYSQVEDGALGLARGDIVTFSLYNYASTNRSFQVKLDGYMVSFGENNKPHLQTNVEIHGMIAADIAAIDGSDKMWRGVITNIATAKSKNNLELYRINVKEVQELPSFHDPFRGMRLRLAETVSPQDGALAAISAKVAEKKPLTAQEDALAWAAATGVLPPETTNPLKPTQVSALPAAESVPGYPLGGPGWVKEATSKILTRRKSEDREFKDSKDSFKCDDCKQTVLLSVGALHRMQFGPDQGTTTVLLKLCSSCFKSTITDTSHQDNLVAEKRAQLLVVNSFTNPSTMERTVH